MSMFISKALRRAEVFLEQVDESVAQASRRLVVEGATGAVDDVEEEDLYSDEDVSVSRASAIPRAEERSLPEQTEVLELEDGWGDHPEDPDGLANDDDILVPEEFPLDQVAPQLEASADADVNLQPELDAQQSSPATVPVAENDLPETSGLPTVEVNEQYAVPTVESSSAATSAKASPAKAPPIPTTELKVSSPGARPLSMKSASMTSMRPGVESEDFVQALKAESAELRDELESVETEFEKTRREKSKLVKNLKRMKEIVSEMDESLQDKSAEARQLEEELVQAKDELAALRVANKQTDARGKDALDTVRKELSVEIDTLRTDLGHALQEGEALQQENERLNEALLRGNEVDLATADGARRDASQAHKAYEAERLAHRETRQLAKEREEKLQEEAALAAVALATGQRKAEEAAVAATTARAAQRATESKLTTVTSARDSAFARLEDLEEALRMYQGSEINEAPGQKEAKTMQTTVAELENALEAKNVELNRLEGEVEALRAAFKNRRDATSPRSPGQIGRGGDHTNTQEVEIKLRHMADSALRKQAQLEVLRSENRALQHQLTTERKRTREAQAMAAAASSSRQSIRGGFRGLLDIGEDERGGRAYGVRDGPLARFRVPRHWPRSISNVLTALDQFSAQALALLRKEPFLRLVILFYIAGLHLFVYAILHWHIDAVTGTVDNTHGRVASAATQVVSQSTK